MRALIQRVTGASVMVEQSLVSRISDGLLVFLGVGKQDQVADADYLADKILGLRVFEDQNGKMNLSLLETGGELLVVSQFTLYADTRKGKRPSFVGAMEPEGANSLYEYFCGACCAKGAKVSKGVFRAEMQVSLVNNGPVTLMVDSQE